MIRTQLYKPKRKLRTKNIVKSESTSKLSYGPKKAVRREEEEEDEEIEQKVNSILQDSDDEGEDNEIGKDDSDNESEASAGDDAPQAQAEDDEEADYTNTKFNLLTEDDKERAEQLIEEEVKEVEEYKSEQKEKKKEELKQIKKAKPILRTVEHTKEYQQHSKLNEKVLNKYKRPTHPVSAFDQGVFQVKSEKANRQEIVRKALWADTARAKAEMSLAETEILRDIQVAGGIKLDKGDVVQKTAQLSQSTILDNVDVASQKKVFDIELKTYGPYQIKYTMSGRKLLLGGNKGHVASMDWRRFDLQHEIFMKDAVKDMVWMMDDAMYAVTQNRLTYVYNEFGHEIHRMTDFANVFNLEYLPYHFLLVGGRVGKKPAILYKDISLGKMVAEIQMEENLTCMTQNPWNALIIAGHPNGTVSMVTPRDEAKKPTITMLCHKGPVHSAVVDQTGKFMVTAGKDNLLKVWDIRKTFNALAELTVPVSTVKSLAVSDKGMLAMATKSDVFVWKHATQIDQDVYMRHKVPFAEIASLDFCPYEDVLGIGHSRGVSSILIPGAGQQRIDSRLPNPYIQNKRLREFNVKQLVDKLPFEMITLDPTIIGTSGKRTDDYKFKKGIELSEDFKKELENSGIVNKKAQEERKKRLRASQDERRDLLFEENAKKKQKLTKKWWESKESNALARFGGDQEAAEVSEAKEEKAETAEEDRLLKKDSRAKQFLPKVFAEDSDEDDEGVIRVGTAANQAKHEDDDEEDDEDGEN